MYTSNIVYRDMSSGGGGETMFPANQCDNKSDKWISPTKSLTKPQNEITAASTKDICVLVRTQSSNNEGETATSTLIKSWIWVLAMSKDAKVPRWQGAKWDGDKMTSSHAKQPGHCSNNGPARWDVDKNEQNKHTVKHTVFTFKNVRLKHPSCLPREKQHATSFRAKTGAMLCADQLSKPMADTKECPRLFPRSLCKKGTLAKHEYCAWVTNQWTLHRTMQPSRG